MTLRPCTDGRCKRAEEDADWGIYSGCFPRGIELSDIDGFVEVNSHFLFIDRKKDTGNPGNFRWGQEQAQTRLARLPHVTFITEILLPDGSHIWRIKLAGQEYGWRILTRDQARQWLISWSKHVEGASEKPSLQPGRSATPPESFRRYQEGR